MISNLLNPPKSLAYVAVTAGDGNCGYRGVLAGLIECAQSSAHFKQHLLKCLPTLMKAISTSNVTRRLGTSYITSLQHGCEHLM